MHSKIIVYAARCVFCLAVLFCVAVMGPLLSLEKIQGIVAFSVFVIPSLVGIVATFCRGWVRYLVAALVVAVPGWFFLSMDILIFHVSGWQWPIDLIIEFGLPVTIAVEHFRDPETKAYYNRPKRLKTAHEH